MVFGPCNTRIVSIPQIPGQIAFRPPEYPAIRWGSINAVAILSSASRYTVSTYIGAPTDVLPRYVIVPVSRDR